MLFAKSIIEKPEFSVVLNIQDLRKRVLHQLGSVSNVLTIVMDYIFVNEISYMKWIDF